MLNFFFFVDNGRWKRVEATKCEVAEKPDWNRVSGTCPV